MKAQLINGLKKDQSIWPLDGARQLHESNHVAWAGFYQKDKKNT